MKKLLTALFLTLSLPSFSQPFYATIAGGDLYSFDLVNCTRHFIGSTGQEFGDIAFTTDGRLWGIVGGELFHIDTATAYATSIGPTGLGAVSLVGLNDSVLLAEYGMNLYGINASTASSYYIDTIGYQAAGDLVWYDDDLYMVTAGGQIIRMMLNNNYTDILSVTAIGDTIPTCEGAVTSSFADNYNAIVGFNGHNLIKICQVDGSTQMLCPDLNIGGTAGAASMRLAKQVPKPSSCTMPTTIPDTADTSQAITPNDFFSIFPNPTASELKVKKGNKPYQEFIIYNMLGQRIMTGKLENDITSIPVNTIASGVYCIELSGGNEITEENFIVIH